MRLGPLLAGGESERCAEEIEERSLAGVASPNEKYATSLLVWGSEILVHYCLLKRGGILSPSQPPGTIDTTDHATGIAVPAAIRHAFSPSIWIHLI